MFWLISVLIFGMIKQKTKKVKPGIHNQIFKTNKASCNTENDFIWNIWGGVLHGLSDSQLKAVCVLLFCFLLFLFGVRVRHTCYASCAAHQDAYDFENLKTWTLFLWILLCVQPVWSCWSSPADSQAINSGMIYAWADLLDLRQV